MALSQKAVKGLLSDHIPEWKRHTNAAKILRAWATGNHEKPRIPNKATEEYRELTEATTTPWGILLTGAVSQVLHVENHRRADSSDSSKVFSEVWQRNNLVGRQSAVYQDALGQNMAYVTTLPGKQAYTKLPTVEVRGMPATKLAAFYDVDGEDNFARFGIWGELQVVRNADPKMLWRVYDEEAVYYLTSKEDGDKMEFISREEHPAQVTPIHRFAPRLDLEGNATGQIEPFLPVLRRLDQDVFDRLVVQRFNSWRVRWIAGLAEPETDAQKRSAALALRIEDLLIASDPNAKFGTLDPTDMAPFITAHEADIRDLAAVSQTPPHHLLGQMANLSAEALAAAEASLMRKVKEIKASFAQSWDQALRTSAFILEETRPGEDFLNEALDYETQTRWADMESRSLSQTADALGKLAQMLNIPVEMLWERLPFWTKDDTTRAKDMIEEQGLDAVLNQILEGTQAAGQDAGGQ